MKKLHKIALITASLLAFAVSAHATSTVDVWGESLTGFSQSTINNFYNGISNTTSNIISGDLNTNNLAGVNLLWATQPANDYTLAEITTMSNYLANGGRIAFMGEHGAFAPTQDQRITAAIAALGGHISINLDYPDGDYHQATVQNGQILAHALTTDVNTYDYACFASLNLSGSAQALMVGTNHDQVMMAYENIGAGMYLPHYRPERLGPCRQSFL